MRYCRNCGQETGRPLWCGDCWRMIWKTLIVAVIGEAVRLAAARWF